MPKKPSEELDKIRKIAPSMSTETCDQMRSLIRDISRLSLLLDDAREAARSSRLTVEEVFYFWILAAVECGVVTEEEIEKLDGMALLLLLDDKRDAWMEELLLIEPPPQSRKMRKTAKV